MSRQLRGIIALLVVIAILTSGVLVVGRLLGNKDTASASSSTSPFLYQCEPKEVQSIWFKNEQGTFDVHRQADQSWILDEARDYPASDFYATLETVASGVAYSRTIEENVEDIALYGFDKPMAEVKFTYRNGDKMELLFGVRMPGSAFRYMMEKGKSTVYTVTSNISVPFEADLTTFVGRVLTPAMPTGDAMPTMTHLTLSDTDWDAPLVLQPNVKTGKTALDKQPYRIVSPQEAYVNSGAGTRLADLPKSGLEADAIEKLGPSEADLEAYSLKEPKHTLEYNIGGKDYKVLLSRKDAAQEKYYAMLPGGNIIYSFDSNSLSWLDQPLQAFAGPHLLAADLAQLAKVNLSSGADRYEFILTQTGGDAQNPAFTVSANGKTLENTDYFKTFLELLNSGIWTDVATREPAEDAVPELSITFTYLSNLNLTPDTITYTKLEERLYYIAVNGEGYFTCGASYLNKVNGEVQKLMNNEAVDTHF